MSSASSGPIRYSAGATFVVDAGKTLYAIPPLGRLAPKLLLLAHAARPGRTGRIRRRRYFIPGTSYLAARKRRLGTDAHKRLNPEANPGMSPTATGSCARPAAAKQFPAKV